MSRLRSSIKGKLGLVIVAGVVVSDLAALIAVEWGMPVIAAAALAAAEEILARAAKLDEAEAAAGHPPLGLDIALHEGEVTYGNVGTEDRLDFTVIGPPVNLTSRLLELAKRFGDRADDGVHVHHDLTQEELAQLVGASRETVNKALADFVHRGWIQLQGKSVVVLDEDRLRRRAR